MRIESDIQYGRDGLRAKDSGVQYGLRGIDPYNGKSLPYKIETPDGIGVRSQENVDSQILVDSWREEANRLINLKVSKAKPKS